MKKALPLAGLALLGAGYFMYRAGAPSATPLAGGGKATQAVAKHSERFRGVVDSELRKEIPWARMAIPGSGETRTLAVAASLRLGCTEGDFDAVLGDLKRSTPKKLLLTIESLVPEDRFAPIAREVSEAQLRRGLRDLRIELPSKGPRQLGLFLCKDSDGTGRCAMKPAMDINAVLNENMKAAAKPQPEQARDRIYFFQYLFVDEDGTLATFQNVPVARETFASLGERLATYFPDDKAGAQKKALDRAETLTRTLASVPLRLERGGLALTLPARDAERCPQLAQLMRDAGPPRGDLVRPVKR